MSIAALPWQAHRRSACTARTHWPRARVCPAQAILVSPDGVVQQADESRCIHCENCVCACPFGVPKLDKRKEFMRKCNLCYDRTSLDKGPMCATLCPTQALFYGTYEEWLNAGRSQQGARPINIFYFGSQAVRTRNYVVVSEERDSLDLLALAAEASLGRHGNLPEPTAQRNVTSWQSTAPAGIPIRQVSAEPWTPRTSEPTPHATDTSDHK